MGLIQSRFRKLLGIDNFVNLQRAVIELNDVKELRKIFGWQFEPILDDKLIFEFKYLEDVNERRVRDAECLGTIARNINPSVCLDIGTGLGYSAALIAKNAPQAKIFTINIPPDDIKTGKGGKYITKAFEADEIGSYYRERNFRNITQILANTANWEPNIGIINLAFIDGCHDTNFVINDTIKLLKHTKPGSFILWHDFNLDLIYKYHWISSVCLGVERLFSKGLLNGRIFHLRDSWIGIYKV